MRVHQFHYSVAPADAITNQMLWIREELSKAGIGGELYAVDRKNGVEDRVRAYDTTAMADCDLLLIHHSQGNPELQTLFNLKTNRALVYHNITPPQFFRHDPLVAEQCHFGRLQLSWFVPNIVAAFADSEYNADELMHNGHVSVSLLPLFPLPPEPMFPRPHQKGDGPLRLLFVGRLSPHKNQATLIRMAAYLKRMMKDDFRLTLVGSGDPVYKRYLDGLVKTLSLEENVTLTGKVSQETLHSHYVESDIFICVSQHEGFCIPIIEAMRANTAVFAVPKTAVVETLGGAGVELNTESPFELARIITVFAQKPDWLDAIRVTQHKRLVDLAQFQNGEMVVDRIRYVLEHSAKASS